MAASQIIRRWYWPIAAILTLAIWLVLALLILPLKDSSGSYATYPYGLITSFENKALDLMFQVRDVLKPGARGRGFSEPVTIIEVDEKSIKASRVRLQKWPRDWYARLIDRASAGGASVIGLDLYLSEEGGVSAEDKLADQKLHDAIDNAGNVVVAEKLEAGGIPAITPLPQFSEAASAVGFVDLPQDSDGAVRVSQLFRLQPGQPLKFSFAAALAQLFSSSELQAEQGGKVLVGDRMNVRLGNNVESLRNDRTMQLDFRGRTPSFRTVSAADILFNSGAPVSDDLFRDRVVLIGATNNDAPDLFLTPFYDESGSLARIFDRNLPLIPARTPGIELHATSLATLLFGSALVRPAYSRQVLLLLIPMLLVGLAVFQLRALWSFLSVAFLLGAAVVVSCWAFDNHNLILPLASAITGMLLLTPIGLGIRYGYERALRSEKEAERAQIMDIFERCVSAEVAEQLWERRDSVSLGGERRLVTVVFTDIRNFTTISENARSDKVVEWLNQYFGRMHNVVCSHGGHINKFIGDGLMIVFGAPLDRGAEVEARAAVACGLEMLAEVDRLDEEWRDSERPQIKIGCGIHTGEATCGIVGAERRLEYTLIGDTVNLAARLESTTKEKGVPILISDATAQYLGDDYETTPMGEVKVKGKTAYTSVLTVHKKGANAPAPAAQSESRT